MAKRSSAAGQDASLGDRPSEVTEVADLEVSGDRRVAEDRLQDMVVPGAAGADMSSQTAVDVSKSVG